MQTDSKLMATKILHVASAQIVSDGGIEETLPRIDALSQAAALLGADVILFSELAVNGYALDMPPAEVKALAQPLDGPSVQKLLASAAAHGICILAGFLEGDDEKIYNSHLIAMPGMPPRVQRKHILTDPEIQAGLSPGPGERDVFTIKGVRCALVICADTGIPGLADHLRSLQVDIRFVPTGGGGCIDDMLPQSELATPEGRQRYTANRPRVCMPDAFDPGFSEWGSALVTSNALGRAGKSTCHQGHCIIVDALGVLRAQAHGTIIREHMHEQLINAIVEWPRINDLRSSLR